MVDEEGRYLFLKGKLGNRRVTFAAVYSPNESQVSFIHNITFMLLEFRSGLLILGGDLNVILNPHVDCSSGSSTLS